MDRFLTVDELHEGLQALARDKYDFLEASGLDPTASREGTASHHYAGKYGTLALVTEVPYFEDGRVTDPTPTGTRRREAILAGIRIQGEIVGEMRAVFDLQDRRSARLPGGAVDPYVPFGSLRDPRHPL